ncbi:MAG: hypothetical protein C3F12_12290 [Candidatus Methylomirabilota bacterium]|nr:HDOD domain-containing protein [Candidatus Methylomirabilis sp.]PWB44010.1 MAG: hypothetical protein C3F12_12290 [candidate division NC10 bacterium]
MAALSTHGTSVDTPVPALDELIGSVREISTIPQIALRIIDVVNNPRSTGADLEMVVGSDPSLAARILRTANSAAYGLRRPVKTIAWAINVLGTNEVRNLAVTALIAERFKGDVVVGSYTRKGLWRHMVCVGLAARLVASRAGLRTFSEAFLAGLLHDVGIALLDQYLHRPFAEVITTLKPGVSLSQAERAQLGFDHAQFGARVAEQWRFPPVILSAIRCHHAPERCSNESQSIAQAVDIANFICTSKGIRSMGASSIAPPSLPTMTALSIDRQGLKVLYDDLDAELAKAHTLINI